MQSRLPRPAGTPPEYDSEHSVDWLPLPNAVPVSSNYDDSDAEAALCDWRETVSPESGTELQQPASSAGGRASDARASPRQAAAQHGRPPRAPRQPVSPAQATVEPSAAELGSPPSTTFSPQQDANGTAYRAQQQQQQQQQRPGLSAALVAAAHAREECEWVRREGRQEVSLAAADALWGCVELLQGELGRAEARLRQGAAGGTGGGECNARLVAALEERNAKLRELRAQLDDAARRSQLPLLAPTRQGGRPPHLEIAGELKAQLHRLESQLEEREAVSCAAEARLRQAEGELAEWQGRYAELQGLLQGARAAQAELKQQHSHGRRERARRIAWQCCGALRATQRRVMERLAQWALRRRLLRRSLRWRWMLAAAAAVRRDVHEVRGARFGHWLGWLVRTHRARAVEAEHRTKLTGQAAEEASQRAAASERERQRQEQLAQQAMAEATPLREELAVAKEQERLARASCAAGERALRLSQEQRTDLLRKVEDLEQLVRDADAAAAEQRRVADDQRARLAERDGELRLIQEKLMHEQHRVVSVEAQKEQLKHSHEMESKSKRLASRQLRGMAASRFFSACHGPFTSVTGWRAWHRLSMHHARRALARAVSACEHRWLIQIKHNIGSLLSDPPEDDVQHCIQALQAARTQLASVDGMRGEVTRLGERAERIDSLTEQLAAAEAELQQLRGERAAKDTRLRLLEQTVEAAQATDAELRQRAVQLERQLDANGQHLQRLIQRSRIAEPIGRRRQPDGTMVETRPVRSPRAGVPNSPRPWGRSGPSEGMPVDINSVTSAEQQPAAASRRHTLPPPPVSPRPGAPRAASLRVPFSEQELRSDREYRYSPVMELRGYTFRVAYKLCSTGDNVGVWFVPQGGAYDDVLEWPMPYSVRVDATLGNSVVQSVTFDGPVFRRWLQENACPGAGATAGYGRSEFLPHGAIAQGREFELRVALVPCTDTSPARPR